MTLQVRYRWVGAPFGCLCQRLTPTQIEALVVAYRAGVRQPVLAERYDIGLTSVKKILRQDRELQVSLDITSRR
jgi:hypothetical protein